MAPADSDLQPMTKRTTFILTGSQERHEDRSLNMELLYLLLPIIGAFLLLFSVCCCGRKLKKMLHIPKEVVIGSYAATRLGPSSDSSSSSSSSSSEDEDEEEEIRRDEQQENEQNDDDVVEISMANLCDFDEDITKVPLDQTAGAGADGACGYSAETLPSPARGFKPAQNELEHDTARPLLTDSSHVVNVDRQCPSPQLDVLDVASLCHIASPCHSMLTVAKATPRRGHSPNGFPRDVICDSFGDARSSPSLAEANVQRGESPSPSPSKLSQSCPYLIHPPATPRRSRARGRGCIDS